MRRQYGASTHITCALSQTHVLVCSVHCEWACVALDGMGAPTLLSVPGPDPGPVGKELGLLLLHWLQWHLHTNSGAIKI